MAGSCNELDDSAHRAASSSSADIFRLSSRGAIMLKRTAARILFGLAAATALVWWKGRRSIRAQYPRGESQSDVAPHRNSKPLLAANGRMDDDALADRSSADSFPASDPPSRMGTLVVRSPSRREQKTQK